jgi:site-specific DNA recombinase
VIDEKMYLERVATYKARQSELIATMQLHEKADHNFYITANLVMQLASRARSLFESSEVAEKRELLNLVFQNLELLDKKLSATIREPFLAMMDYKHRPTNWRRWDGFRTFHWTEYAAMAQKFINQDLLNVS